MRYFCSGELSFKILHFSSRTHSSLRPSKGRRTMAQLAKRLLSLLWGSGDAPAPTKDALCSVLGSVVFESCRVQAAERIYGGCFDPRRPRRTVNCVVTDETSQCESLMDLSRMH